MIKYYQELAIGSRSKRMESDEEILRETISRRYLELSGTNDKDLQDIVSLASEICGTPIALITLLDRDKQYFKAKKGILKSGTERQVAFCNYTVKQEDLFVVNDATTDERFKENPLVTGNENFQFYAGFPIKSPLGINIGSICVVDNIPRKLSAFQEKCLKILARQVIQRLELGMSLQILEENLLKLQKQQKAIEQSEVMLKAFFDAPNEYQILLNKELEVIAVNTAAREMVRQYRCKEIKTGEFLTDYLTEKTIKDLQAIAPFVLGGTTIQDERIILGIAGEEHWVKFTISPAYNNKKEIIGIAMVGTDINTEKKQEEKIKNQYKTLSEIAQWQSHELRHPVAAILGITSLIKEENYKFREEYVSSLETVTKQLDLMINKMVNDTRSV